MQPMESYDVVVVGGGPAGATAASDLAQQGRSVLLLDKAGRIKPCGGAVPPRLIRDFAIPDSLIVARARSARIIAPSDRTVDMPIDGEGYVGMVDRCDFDEWLRRRAAMQGADWRQGSFQRLTRDAEDGPVVTYRTKEGDSVSVRARTVIGADGANSAVVREAFPQAEKIPFVFAYHEVVRSPQTPEPQNAAFDGERCDVYYQGRLSPDFYSWVFPHGDTASIGTGTAVKGLSLRGAVDQLRRDAGLDGVETLRCEGAPIPLRPRKRWDNGRDVLLAGDAAGVVAPASGEGIYYAMLGGRLAAEAVGEFLVSGDAKALAQARRRFMKTHGRVFWILGIMQRFWYVNDQRRERFVSICGDRDVQRLTWESYMNKELVRRDPLAHLRIFFKDLAHLFRLVSP
ncbi:geranylgeranyl diphosphate reductase [Pelagibius sp.]|uniref:geranylgeranyl diphosphate reductase n=1 Tax=Pelagibius sp. TaxID=1931238 RepID=UPI003B50F543